MGLRRAQSLCYETADIAVQAALTGHMVLSTLHTNDATSAFTRLIDMGIQPFLVLDSLLGILAQSLIRKVCSKCKHEHDFSPSLKEALDLEGKLDEDTKYMEGKGCGYCNNTGYKGRTRIFELLNVTTEIREASLYKASTEEIKKIAFSQGMKSLREVAIGKLLLGVTSPEEVLRVT